MSKKVVISKVAQGKYLVAVKVDEPIGTLDLSAFKITAYRVGVGELVYYMERENEPDRLLLVHQVEVIERVFSHYPEAVLWFLTIREHVAQPKQIF